MFLYSGSLLACKSEMYTLFIVNDKITNKMPYPRDHFRRLTLLPPSNFPRSHFPHAFASSISYRTKRVVVFLTFMTKTIDIFTDTDMSHDLSKTDGTRSDTLTKCDSKNIFPVDKWSRISMRCYYYHPISVLWLLLSAPTERYQSPNRVLPEIVHFVLCIVQSGHLLLLLLLILCFVFSSFDVHIVNTLLAHLVPASLLRSTRMFMEFCRVVLHSMPGHFSSVYFVCVCVCSDLHINRIYGSIWIFS